MESRVPKIDEGDRAYAGQAAYTRKFLAVYDAVVFGFNSPVLWRCPKKDLLAMYDAHVSACHLDIGVGTGRLLDECRFPVEDPDVTLMDLNLNSLYEATRRIARYRPRAHRASVLEPWGLAEGGYESIGMCYLLHCLPGSMPQKAVVFQHAKKALAPNGTLFGATVLGDRALHTRLSWPLVKASNRRGFFSNLGDDLDSLDGALEEVFDSHDLRVQGSVALFTGAVNGRNLR